MSRIADRKQALETLKEIDKDKKNYMIIHYSCESFFDKNDGHSPRITSIAVRKFDDGQTDLFAIHKESEIKHINFDNIQNEYDVLEKEMLQNFFEFLEKNENKKWIHWNMRDSNYGFKAIEHRFKVLGGVPFKINDQNKIDLSQLFINLYGKEYIDNPRIVKLKELNNIHQQGFLNGKDEADAFKKQEYIKLSMSTAAKVNLFSNFLRQSIDNRLKVLTPKRNLYGTTLKGYFYTFKETTIYKFIIWILNLIIGGFIGAFIANFF